jgi:hypothetical protein
MKVFNEELNVAVFTTRFVLREGECIQNVFHHNDDGAWEFTGETQASDDKDYLIVSLQEIIDLDQTILELADLPLGGSAYRSSIDKSWTRS